MSISIDAANSSTIINTAIMHTPPKLSKATD